MFPAYGENPVAETLRAVGGLSTDGRFAIDYTAFLRDMVYGETPDSRRHCYGLGLADGLRRWS